jgi:hypothetical protein
VETGGFIINQYDFKKDFITPIWGLKNYPNMPLAVTICEFIISKFIIKIALNPKIYFIIALL